MSNVQQQGEPLHRSEVTVTTGSIPRTVRYPVLLRDAATDFLQEVARQAPSRRSRYEPLLDRLEEYLGRPAPLLAYTRLTGEGWRRSLPVADQADAAELLTEFRAHLRDGGWLDAARPVNQFD